MIHSTTANGTMAGMGWWTKWDGGDGVGWRTGGKRELSECKFGPGETIRRRCYHYEHIVRFRENDNIAR